MPENTDANDKTHPDSSPSDSSESEPGKEIASNASKEETPLDLIPGIKDVPPDVKRQISTMFMGMIQSVGRSEHPLFSKFRPEHVTQYLENMRRDEEREHEIVKSNRWFYLAYTIIGLGALGAAIVYLSSRDKDLLLLIIQFLVVIAGGLGAGYGLAKRKNDDE